MKILQKTIAATATSAILLGSLVAPITILAATTSKNVKATPIESPIPTVEPTVEPTIAPVETTPAPQSTLKWIMTHKKISLGILLVVAAAGYGLYYSSKKNKQSPPEDQPKSEDEAKPEEESKPEDQTPQEDQTKKEEV